MAKKNKRYYQSVKDRMAESRGMERYETKKNIKDSAYRSVELYAGPSLRRQMEMEGSGMIYEDRDAIANLPQNVMMKEYAKMPYPDYQVPDTIKGIDVQMYEDSDEKKSNRYKTGKYPEKY